MNLKEFKQLLDDTFRGIIASISEPTSETDQYMKRKLDGWLVDLWARGGSQEDRRQWVTDKLARITLDVGDVNVEFELNEREFSVVYTGPHSGTFPPIDLNDSKSNSRISTNIVNLLRLILNTVEFPVINSPNQLAQRDLEGNLQI